MLQEGMKAPDFTLADETGTLRSLSEFAGKRVVLYFYPRDNTPGCTKEACAFRDEYSEFVSLGVVVLGVSPDTVEKHKKFKESFRLPFTLLADPEKKMLQAYGVIGEKKLYGKISLGVQRSTLIIGPDGTIERVFPKVTPASHAEDILAVLRA